MKVYAAIGHFRKSKNITSVAMKTTTKKDFVQNLYGNEFVPYIVITEQMFEKLGKCDSWELFKQVKKMTTNYRIQGDVTEYLEQCFDILADRINDEK